jgi:hypothetical protein
MSGARLVLLMIGIAVALVLIFQAINQFGL